MPVLASIRTSANLSRPDIGEQGQAVAGGGEPEGADGVLRGVRVGPVPAPVIAVVVELDGEGSGSGIGQASPDAAPVIDEPGDHMARVRSFQPFAVAVRLDRMEIVETRVAVPGRDEYPGVAVRQPVTDAPVSKSARG